MKDPLYMAVRVTGDFSPFVEFLKTLSDAWFYVEHDGASHDNPHIHAYIEWTQCQKTLKEKIKAIGYSGNKQFECVRVRKYRSRTVETEKVMKPENGIYRYLAYCLTKRVQEPVFTIAQEDVDYGFYLAGLYKDEQKDKQKTYKESSERTKKIIKEVCDYIDSEGLAKSSNFLGDYWDRRVVNSIIEKCETYDIVIRATYVKGIFDHLQCKYSRDRFVSRVLGLDRH